jgi:hypothetical protein
MYKTKRVAAKKHRIKRKKLKLKRRQQGSGASR